MRTLAAVDKYKEATSSNGMENGRRLRGLVLLLRYSGMRISDAVQFTADRSPSLPLYAENRRAGPCGPARFCPEGLGGDATRDGQAFLLERQQAR